MKIKITQKDDFTLLNVLDNRIDAVNAAELRLEISQLAATGIQRIVLDISAVTFMDSSGLGVMVSILKMLGGSGDLIISGAQGIVADLFKLTRMNRVFRMCDGIEEAEHIMVAA